MPQHKPANADRQITIGEKTYTIRFSVRAMAALQDHFQLPSLDAVGKRLQDSDNLSVNDVVAMLWAGLRTHHRDLSIEDAMDLLDEMGLDALQDTLGDALAGAMPEAVAGAEDAGDPQ